MTEHNDHDATSQVGGELELKLTEAYHAKWFPEAEADDRSKIFSVLDSGLDKKKNGDMPWEHHRLVHSGLGSSTSWSGRLASVVELSSCHMLTAYRNFLRVFPFSFMAKPVQFSIQSILISIQCSPKLFFKITPRFSEMWVVPFSFNFV